ncbi:MAG TPA: choice-of-anchor Q domain-containing protein [Polyangiaceae bacterium]
MVAAIAVAALASSCKSTTITLTPTTDGQPGSLRAAIATANSAGASEVVVQMAAGTYELTLCGADDGNAMGDLDIFSDAKVTLVALEPGVTIKQTCAGERVIDQRGRGLLTLKGVGVTGGSILSSEQWGLVQGGGIRAESDVTLQGARIFGNSATATLGSAQGGGLFVRGVLRSMDSSIFENSTNARGTSTYPAPQIVLGASEGGGAYVYGEVFVLGGDLSRNDAIAAWGCGGVRGGAIAQEVNSQAPVALGNVSLSGNRAYAEEAIACAATGGAVAAAGALTASNITAVGNLAIAGSTDPWFRVSGSGTARGGALAGASSVEITSSHFDANRVRSGHGPWGGCATFACQPVGNAGAANGGAVWASGALSLNACTLSANTAAEGDGRQVETALRGGGATASESSVSAVNVTFTGNASTAREASCTSPTQCIGFDVPGAGAAASAAVRITLHHAAIADNSGATILAAPRVVSTASVALSISGTSLCAAGTAGSGSSYSHFADASCALTGTRIYQNSAGLVLQPLANNGGAVPTRLPPAGSPLIDAIPTASCSLTIDARGFPRPSGNGCDIGAVEL